RGGFRCERPARRSRGPPVLRSVAGHACAHPTWPPGAWVRWVVSSTPKRKSVAVRGQNEVEARRNRSPHRRVATQTKSGGEAVRGGPPACGHRPKRADWACSEWRRLL